MHPNGIINAHLIYTHRDISTNYSCVIHVYVVLFISMRMNCSLCFTYLSIDGHGHRWIVMSDSSFECGHECCEI